MGLMTFIAPDVTEPRAPAVADERTMLQGWLDEHRGVLLRKCAGLTAEQLKARSVEPSSISLLGLVRHMAEVERWWFRRMVGGAELPQLYCTEASPDGDFDDLQDADPAADFATLAEEIRLGDEAAAGAKLEDVFTHPRRGTELSVRWVYVHMIEEYARHNGHADLVRERIDGATDA
jgi:uncharacterized damage-inducible protein DinB